jgi:hypothetical protein
MDGAKPSSISASELYSGIGTAKAPLAVDAQRGAVNANQGKIVSAVFLAPDYIALWNRDRQLEPAG